MCHFLFEEKEHRVNINFRRGGRIPESASSLNRMIRQISGKKQKRAAEHFKGGGAARDTRQKCITKMRYSNSLAAHKTQITQYLVREGTDKEGNRAELYGTDIEEYKKNMVDKNFRIFLSPQNTGVDLTAITKSFVKRLELDTGYKVYWEAANHYNTAHPHAHLIINGRDKNGKDVEFSRDFVKSFMRENARNICTAMVGSRSMREIALEKEAELTANRKIAFDERIKERMNGTLSVDLDGIKDKSSYVKRLDHLRKIGLGAVRK
jgi:type IV secretory pathway VirD2 relaxase